MIQDRFLEEPYCVWGTCWSFHVDFPNIHVGLFLQTHRHSHWCILAEVTKFLMFISYCWIYLVPFVPLWYVFVRHPPWCVFNVQKTCRRIVWGGVLEMRLRNPRNERVRQEEIWWTQEQDPRNSCAPSINCLPAWYLGWWELEETIKNEWSRRIFLRS